MREESSSCPGAVRTPTFGCSERLTHGRTLKGLSTWLADSEQEVEFKGAVRFLRFPELTRVAYIGSIDGAKCQALLAAPGPGLRQGGCCAGRGRLLVSRPESGFTGRGPPCGRSFSSSPDASWTSTLGRPREARTRRWSAFTASGSVARTCTPLPGSSPS